MPVATTVEVVSGFVGFTVVFALQKASTPERESAIPRMTNAIAYAGRHGMTRSSEGA
jgi:hypothetical protein